MRIAIVIPSGDMVHADFTFCLTRLMQYQIPDTSFAIVNPRSSLIQKARWSGVTEALKMRADKILFIDSDQTFPADALARLLRHDKPIVSAASVTRRPPIQYTAKDREGKRIDFAHAKGLCEVASNGFPFCLINTSVFLVLPPPWFNVSFSEGRWESEDEMFFHAARREGYKVWVDADLTKQIGHIGTKVFSEVG